MKTQRPAGSDFSALPAGAKSKSPLPLLGLLGAILFCLFLISFCLGRYGVPLVEVVRILFDRISPLAETWTPEMETVVINIRLPRILLACLVGASLSMAGAAYQAVFQNPLASPDVLGASSGAALGAALSILLGFSAAMVTSFAFFLSIITVFAAFLIAVRAPGTRSMNLVLAGMMVSSLCTAGTSYIKLVADPSNKLPEITYWLIGSLSGARLSSLPTAVLPMALGMIPLLLLGWQMNLLTMGDDEARAMGVNANSIRVVVIISATLITAASIAVSGMIGWVGLVVPHLCRRIMGSNNRLVMPASMLMGASFLLLVDNISRNLLPTEIPIGILTAVIGAPFFIYLLTKKEKLL